MELFARRDLLVKRAWKKYGNYGFLTEVKKCMFDVCHKITLNVSQIELFKNGLFTRTLGFDAGGGFIKLILKFE